MLDYFKDWWRQPFKGATDMNGLDWFLLVGLIIIIMIAWGRVLAFTREVTS